MGLGKIGVMIPGAGAAISGTAAFFFGLVSISKFRERSGVAIFATIVGFIALLIVMGEVIEELTHPG